MPCTPSPNAAHEGVACDLPYAEWPGAEPAIVLVPGIFSTQRALSALARRALPARRVIAFDLRGRGRAPMDGPFGIDRHARDLWTAIDALGLDAPVLAGHSLGAFVVAVAAGSRPAGRVGLVLLDGGLWSPAGVPVELVHAMFADDRARLARAFADVEAYADGSRDRADARGAARARATSSQRPDGGLTPSCRSRRSTRTSRRSPPTRVATGCSPRPGVRCS